MIIATKFKENTFARRSVWLFISVQHVPNETHGLFVALRLGEEQEGSQTSYEGTHFYLIL